MQIEFGTMIAISQFNDIIKVSNSILAYSIKSLNCALKLTHNGVEYYYSGYTWREDYKELNLVPNGDVVELPVSFGSKTGEAVLQLFIFSIDVDWQLGNSAYNGAYLGIKALNFAKSEAVSMLERMLSIRNMTRITTSSSAARLRLHRLSMRWRFRE
jgi:hypothetical protein